MPLWHVYHPIGAYSAADKQNFARDITGIYTAVGLPEFYAMVLFHEVDTHDFYVGGRPAGDAVRIVVEHLARHLDDPVRRRAMTERLDAVMRPYTRDRGLHWEFHIDETPRDLWMIAGLWPPDPGTDAEKAWAAANRPLPY
ncbi:tautomerase family protein [Nocardia sp. CDC159]|uniref:Tautomerase family protein n=1 Tax=Nocardia pulmonis TaxID=2951408 RepID=A0A9X2E8E9_9NOCA|nr:MULTISPECIES: tautomerase family protein [Nocardia]MCM6775654.1 tautomerase family protein [Nocardia pulmonis]MCM6788370.1 tautomerase family protein [Nocardia sp. CDC159]